MGIDSNKIIDEHWEKINRHPTYVVRDSDVPSVCLQTKEVQRFSLEFNSHGVPNASIIQWRAFLSALSPEINSVSGSFSSTMDLRKYPHFVPYNILTWFKIYLELYRKKFKTSLSVINLTNRGNIILLTNKKFSTEKNIF